MTTTYCAHQDDMIALGVLGYLQRLGCSTEELTGPDPAPVKNGTLLVSCRSEHSSFPSHFLRQVQNMEKEILNRGFMIPPWAAVSTSVVILNARVLRTDSYVEEQLMQALENLVGTKREKKRRKRTRRPRGHPRFLEQMSL